MNKQIKRFRNYLRMKRYEKEYITTITGRMYQLGAMRRALRKYQRDLNNGKYGELSHPNKTF